MSKLVFASVISEIKQSDIFMTVRARICETPAANLNGARVTEAFIDEIVGNDKYVGLPLNADIKALTSGNYTRLGHLYDSHTGEFHSTQIGSFYKFEKEAFSNGEQNGCYLVGYARIPKRNRKLCKAISELFADGALKFSFELSVGEYEELDDDTILIDASENNYLEGTAIVTFPACEEAVALELVAQKADGAERGENEMKDEQKLAENSEPEVQVAAEETPETVQEEQNDASNEVQAEVQTEQNEEPQNEPEEVVAELEVHSELEEVQDEPVEAHSEPAEVQAEVSETETAAVVVHEEHYETNTVSAFDTDAGKEVRQTVSVSTETTEHQEGTLVQTVDGLHIAETPPSGTPTETPSSETPAAPTGGETGGDTGGKTEEPEEVPVNDAADRKKTAEQMIAELAAVIESLKNEIAELKEAKEVKAEVPAEPSENRTVTAEINPFVSDLKPTTYSLLGKANAFDEKEYSLLSKA